MTSSTERLNQIRNCLAERLTPSLLEVIDESHLHVGHPGALTGGGHFRVKIASPMFHEKKALACHRQIYQALSAFMYRDIHALAIELV